ncbi:hypothetical protein [Jannaschia rubra]|uniref:Small secreted protein n=1 Tax=Jannaschia rubra TaxID=282197 RepID=A0A0M6XNE0_9RHOB|nr:hypothetical protein [Jannaschia rubra]CTQ31544.1 hypothetical protein JAN5088_00302 [Jannaschia rubra]SFF77508.1 hypothetical protein SAMN04488517_101116 [Jannaschia rubra]
MTRKIWMILALMLAAPTLSGCAAAALGAGGAIAADEVAENEGGNLF